MQKIEAHFRVILKLFCLEMQVSRVIASTGLNRVTINNIFDKIRVRIAAICEAKSPFTNGGGNWIKATLVHTGYAAYEAVVQGVKYLFLACSSAATRLYTQVVKNCSLRELLPIIQEHTDTSAVLYTDGFRL